LVERASVDDRALLFKSRASPVIARPSALHGLWDGLAGLLDSFLVPGADVLAALAVVSATGLALLWWRWRAAIRLQMASVGQD
jgi:hypothetical protein